MVFAAPNDNGACLPTLLTLGKVFVFGEDNRFFGERIVPDGGVASVPEADVGDVLGGVPLVLKQASQRVVRRRGSVATDSPDRASGICRTLGRRSAALGPQFCILPSTMGAFTLKVHQAWEVLPTEAATKPRRRTRSRPQHSAEPGWARALAPGSGRSRSSAR